MAYKYTPSKFMLPTSHYDEAKANRAVTFIQNLCHTKGKWAATLEGQAVRYADRIAYMNHDIEDAITAGALSPQALPTEIVQVLGDTKSRRISTLIQDLVANSGAKNLSFSPLVGEAYEALHDFMYSTVYVDKDAKREEPVSYTHLTLPTT